MSAFIDSNKNKWDQLPNEILTAIFKELGLRKLYPCLFVNHQWLTMGQSMLYKDISIEIGFARNVFENRMLDTLVNSSFSPGRWVKKITVLQLKVPDNIFDLDPKTDPLYLLMTHCPAVEDFCFPRNNLFFEMEWTYFQMVLDQNKTWQLRNLATYFDKEDYDRYYACASTFGNSLTTFHLQKRMIDNELHFKPFQKLKSLNISKRVVNDIVDAEKIVHCLPQLTQLDISFHVPKTHQTAAKDKTSKITMTNNIYPNLKEVQLKNFPLSRNQELRFIIEKFPCLKDLRIKVSRGKPWPITKISPEVMRTFFSYLRKISSHCISFRDIDMVRVMDEYYNSIQVDDVVKMDESDGTFDLTFTNLLDEGEKTTTLEITNLEQQRRKVKLTYNLVGGSATDRVIKAKRTMAGVGHFIKELNLSLSGKEGPVTKLNNFLPLVFESCRNIHKLTLSGGELTTDVYKKIIAQALISDLTLHKCLIDTAAFPRLSSLFVRLESFYLTECVYQYLGCTKNDVRITMPGTEIKVLSIKNEKMSMYGVKTRSTSDDKFASSDYHPYQQQQNHQLSSQDKDRQVIFVAVEFGDAWNTQKYYTSDSKVDQGNVVELSKKEYIRLLNKSRRLEDQLSVIQLKLKSLKTLLIFTPQHQVRLSF